MKRVNNFLLTRDKFILKVETTWIYIQCLWTIYIKQTKKNNKKNTKIEKNRRFTILYQEACLQLDMASGDLKDLTRRTASDKILHDKAFSTAKNPKHDGYQRVLASMVYI